MSRKRRNNLANAQPKPEVQGEAPVAEAEAEAPVVEATPEAEAVETGVDADAQTEEVAAEAPVEAAPEAAEPEAETPEPEAPVAEAAEPETTQEPEAETDDADAPSPEPEPVVETPEVSVPDADTTKQFDPAETVTPEATEGGGSELDPIVEQYVKVLAGGKSVDIMPVVKAIFDQIVRSIDNEDIEKGRLAIVDTLSGFRAHSDVLSMENLLRHVIDWPYGSHTNEASQMIFTIFLEASADVETFRANSNVEHAVSTMSALPANAKRNLSEFFKN